MPDKIDPRDKKILIVDDDDTVLDFVSFTVARDGFQVYTAKDGDEAFNKITEIKPDLIVLDMMIPKKGGFEIIKMIQTGDYWKIPVIVVTGRYTDDKFRNNVLFEPNVKDFIVKPAKAPYLMSKIHTLLNTISPEEKSADEKRRQLEERLKPKQDTGDN
ncbi:MAG: hypothetical protein A2252_09300 [Elusimicrobia bacterium RIFOXYA2_FULL_39_19]|nr:MAG: hypothetical protein A2252_09300 [Elusimicrobia bacterium RIFOXYA2_FULL_39_19]